MFEEKNTDGIFFIRRVAIIFGSIAAVVAVALIIILVVPEPEPPETREERAIRIEEERQAFSESLTLEQLLYDFDYFMYVLEHNFPFFGVAYRQYGVDMMALGAEFRANLESGAIAPTALDFFEALRVDYIGRVNGMAHLGLLDRRWFISFLDGAITHAEHNAYSAFFLDMINRNPNTLLFYGGINEIDREERRNQWRYPNNITTDIIEEGRIAYLGIAHMLREVQPSDIVRLRPFYLQIADFEHLIVDIRGNPGGRLRYPFDVFILPHMHFPAVYRHLTFYKGGEHNLNFLNAIFPNPRGLYSEPSHFAGYRVSVKDNMVFGRDTNHPLLDYVQTIDDFEAMDYYRSFSDFFSIYHSYYFRSSFRGQIWLLIDGRTASSASQITALLKQLGMAITVGETARGVHGSPGMEGMHFILPNTGIVVRYDMGMTVCLLTGLIFEEGIPPHHYNLPGKDALETALALINSGAYRD